MLSETDKLHLAEAIPSPWQNSIFQGKESTKQPQSIPTEIKFPNPPGTTSVEVCGDWDEWRTRTALQYSTSENIWHCSVPLPVGTYQCKFLVNNVHWVVTNMLPMLADEGGNNNNQIFVKDSNLSSQTETASAGIGDNMGAPSSSEAPPIFKMYYSAAHMRHREFTPSPSPETSPASPQEFDEQHAQEMHESSSTSQSTQTTTDQDVSSMDKDQSNSMRSSDEKKLCADKCTIL
ncbi:putative Glycogen recognition site of AMP-activated protein kinase [Monocercomonoides exilis]|uniref:putative Glycogen recognition site of AMP-activated protein kinase n=1 Tax=Monocercomonoides exilis TaxID=2049356 RepID=UPI0035594112|nr:putative Glycogen recognition site of AMP-activated protein kinase [Monocercomonoides exilis]|eukprot:MONOS_11575.1-p1 / transcript=MONOS_11575.1 / gene=MONOS_11575 / organism=Monocercomonoides_exilis_PA203 / gene_product=unspecified product / transcript_product=unspecified product / location=Mono_scaffold00588:14848-15549(-) / protein_length=234 / sequence_SO=supercontig / SO=protein_coding / is_pseudo=false